MLEKDFEKMVLNAFIGHRTIKLWKQNVGAFKTGKRFIRCGLPGQSDISGLVKMYYCPNCNRKQWGVRIEIELKNENGKETERQLDWLNDINEFNGIAFVLRAIPNETIHELMRRIEKRITSYVCPDCYEKSRIENLKGAQ
jgi:predicted RNA-binding Zn-ribbon protein involved in translation (DUF1610 family)